MNCILFTVEAIEDGNIHSGRIMPPPDGRITREEADSIREGMIEEGFKVLEYEMVEVQ